MIRLMHILTLPQSAATFLQGQLAWLQQRDFQVTVVTSPGEQLEPFGREEGVQVDSVAMRRAISPLHDLRAVRRLIPLIRRVRPHIVHAHTPKAGLIGMLAARWCNVPVRIYHLHGLRCETSQGWRRQLLATADWQTCRLADHVFAVSPSLRSKAILSGIVAPHQTTVLADGSINGLDAQERFNASRYLGDLRQQTRRRLGIPADALVLGFVGRLVRDKGICELAQAWQQLRDRFPQLHLLLVGPFEQGDAVPQAVRQQLESDPRVHLTGLCWDTPPFYSAMDLFTLPSRREGLPVVLLEAAAMELPVVATRATGCVDAVIDGQTGLLTPADNAPQLAAAIQRYLEDAALRRRHGQAGRQRVLADFQPQRIWQALHEEYHRLLDQAGISPQQPAAPRRRAA